MKDITFKSEEIVTEEYRLILIHAVADCEDKRNGNTVPLTFYFMKDIRLVDADSEEVKRLIELTVMQYGFELVRLQSFKAEPIDLNAEKLWKEDHEQQSFQF